MNTVRQDIATPFQVAIDIVEALPLAEQEELLDLLQRRLLERRRAEIARHAEETLQAVREGCARYGDFADLKCDLLRDDVPEDEDN